MAILKILENGWQSGVCWGKGGGGSPPAPDPAATARAQAGANKEAVTESARVNQINEVSPYGNLTYSGEIGSPDRTRTLTLDPAQQAQLEGQRSLANALTNFGNNTLVPQVQSAFQNPLSFDGLQALPTSEDLNAAAGDVERATFERGLGLLQPEFDRQEDRLLSRLSSQGIPQGTEAFNDAYQQYTSPRDQALENLALSSVQAGRGEQSRLVGLAQGLRQQGISETLTQRSQPINELAALLQGAPAINNPQFAAPAQYNVNPADVQGAIQNQYMGQMNAYNQRQQGQQATMGGLFGLGGSLGAAAIANPAAFSFLSDRRLKRDIEQVGALPSGLPVYRFKYLWDNIERIGVMAQDVLKVIPSAVVNVGEFYAVDYGRLR